MNRYVVGIIGVDDFDGTPGTELRVLKHFFSTLGDTELLNFPGSRGTEIIDWLTENNIDHYYEIDRVTFGLPWKDTQIERTMNAVTACLSQDSDAQWLRYRFDVVPLPPEMTPYRIVTSEDSLRNHWIGA